MVYGRPNAYATNRKCSKRPVKPAGSRAASAMYAAFSRAEVAATHNADRGVQNAVQRRFLRSTQRQTARQTSRHSRVLTCSA